jgi:hypothetical protein
LSEIFPESPDGDEPPEEPGPGTVPQRITVAGMELEADFPPGVIPVSALVVVRCLDTDEDGDPNVLWWSVTPGLPSWEAEGMARYVQHGVRDDWDGCPEGGGPDSEP